MSINRTEKIQANYIINEFIAISGVASAEEINYAEIQPIHVNRIKTILAPNCQDIRNDINAKFREENGKEIGLKIACGYRSKKWDVMQGRSGNGQHPEALAVDILPIGCKNDNMYLKIFYYICSKYATHNGGFAVKFPQFTGGRISTFGFIHIDWRGSLARWNY
jgi:hypothetical protein